MASPQGGASTDGGGERGRRGQGAVRKVGEQVAHWERPGSGPTVHTPVSSRTRPHARSDAELP